MKMKRKKGNLQFYYEKMASLMAWSLLFFSLGQGMLQGFWSAVELKADKMACGMSLLLLSVWFAVVIVLFTQKRRTAFLGTAAFCGGYLLLFCHPVFAGMKTIINEAALMWKKYFGQVPEDTMSGKGADTTLTFILVMTLIFMVEAAIILQEKYWQLSFAIPAVIVGFDLMVGYTPSIQALFFLVGGGIGLLMLGGGKIKREPKHYLVLYVLFIILSAVAIRWGDSVTAPMLARHDQMLEKQRMFEMNLKNGVYFPGIFQNRGKVNNVAVKYTEKEMLSIQANKKPVNNLYLRGYVGDVYDNGKWQQSEGEEPVYSLMKNLYEKAGECSNASISLTLEYTGDKSKYAYLPYYGYDECIEKEFSKTGKNGIIYRSRQKKYQLSVYDTEYDEGCFYDGSGYYIEENSSVRYDTDKESQEKSGGLAGYDDYVLEHYMAEPHSKLSKLDALGEMLADQKTMVSSMWTPKPVGELKGMKSSDDTVRAIQTVRTAIHKMTRYTKTPPVLPYGKDVVEYFLFESQEGYCTHYASAGTLLLRKLGVPARYVTGYVVKESDFSEKKDGTYEASVPDSAQHAWVEVYFPKTGWVPVEMTPGFYTGGEDAVAKGITLDDVENYMNETTSQTDASAGNTPEPSKETPKPDKQQGDRKETADNQTNFFYVGLAAVLLLAIIPGICLIVRAQRKRSVWNSFRLKDTNQSVVNMGHYLYRQLKKAGFTKDSNQTDSAFEQEMMKKLPEEVRQPFHIFMKNLEKARFSNQTLSLEEVVLSRRILKNILKVIRKFRHYNP